MAKSSPCSSSSPRSAFPCCPSTSSTSSPSIRRHRRPPKGCPMNPSEGQQPSNSHTQLGTERPLQQMAGRSSSRMAPSSSSSPRLFLLGFLLLLSIAAKFPAASALPRPEPPGQVPVGAIFTLDKEEGALEAQKVPGWMKAGNGQLFGIPQLKDLGKHQIQLNGRSVPVEVVEEGQGLCGPESSTTWLEIVDPRRMGQLSVEEEFKVAQTLLGTLKEVGVRAADLRVFPLSYLAQYRNVAEKIHEMDGGEEPKADDQLVFLLNISCGELTEQATEIINAVAENGLNFQVVQGTLRKSRLQQPNPASKPADNLKASEGKEEAGGGSSAVLVSLILLVVVLALLVGLGLYWLRNKQAQKRQKQAGNEANGKASTRPGALNSNDNSSKNAAALSPDASMGTVTTPMLPEEATAKKS